MLTTFDVDDYVYEALRAGASGFLLKDAPAEELVRRGAGGRGRRGAAGAVGHPPAHRRLRQPRRARPRRDPPGSTCSLRASARSSCLIARGLSNGEIAAQLVLAEQTVKTHVGHILTKLDLRDRVQAVVLAYETGVVSARLDQRQDGRSR